MAIKFVKKGSKKAAKKPAVSPISADPIKSAALKDALKDPGYALMSKLGADEHLMYLAGINDINVNFEAGKFLITAGPNTNTAEVQIPTGAVTLAAQKKLGPEMAKLASDKLNKTLMQTLTNEGIYIPPAETSSDELGELLKQAAEQDKAEMAQNSPMANVIAQVQAAGQPSEDDAKHALGNHPSGALPPCSEHEMEHKLRVPLDEANRLYQPVQGTSTGARYFVIALTENYKVAARWKSDSLSVRVTGANLSSTQMDYLTAIGFASHDGYASVHVQADSPMWARKIVGSMIGGLGEALLTPYPDMEKLKDKGA